MAGAPRWCVSPCSPHGDADGHVGDPPPDELHVVDDVDMVHEELDELDDTPGRRTSPWVPEMPEQAADAGGSEPAPAGAPASASTASRRRLTSDPAGSSGDH